MKDRTIKVLRKLRRDDMLENPEAYKRATAYEDRRTKRHRTRRAAEQQAIEEELEEAAEIERALMDEEIPDEDNEPTA